jgi:uncharacterized metal-binding protein YceD (DUF177 family)
MKIHLQQIPTEGLHVEGEEPSSILELNDDIARPTGPIVYSLDVGLSDGGLFATGSLSVPLDLVCVACLAHFPYTLSVPDFACQVELSGRETVDLTEPVREDTLLALPPHPHCDWDGERECKAAFRKQAEAPDEPISDTREVWGALDQLKLK